MSKNTAAAWYWYKWNPRDYMTSPRVMTLSWEEHGIYRFLLDFQWINDGIPSDLDEICAIVRGAKRKSVEKVVRLFFSNHPTKGEDHLANPRLFALSQENKRLSEANSINGKKSASSKKNSTTVERPLNDRSTTAIASLQESAEKSQRNSNHAHARESREEKEKEKEIKNTPNPQGGEEGVLTSSEEPQADATEADGADDRYPGWIIRSCNQLPPLLFGNDHFVGTWAEWLSHLSAPKTPGGNFQAVTHQTQSTHLLELLATAKASGPLAAADCLDFAMANQGWKRPADYGAVLAAAKSGTFSGMTVGSQRGVAHAPTVTDEATLAAIARQDELPPFDRAAAAPPSSEKPRRPDSSPAIPTTTDA